jgi:hypothetical protein
MTTQITAEKCPFFICEKCDFKCSKESNYKLHIETNKHKRLHDATLKMSKSSSKKFICVCGNKYNHHSSLAKHKRTCKKLHNSLASKLTDENINSTLNDVNNNDEKNKVIDDVLCSDNKIIMTSEMFIALIKNSEEMIKVIKEQQEQIKGQQEQINNIIPKIGNVTNNNNTTNNFNLNVFLNEHCKDALNITDFIDSLKITLEDLLFSKTNGISRGITDVLIKGLKELDIHKRPIHCTDTKRDIMYIKDEDKWCKDENHELMKNTIVKIADKERTALQQWAIDNPDWMETERKQLDYLTMVRSICEPIENYYNYEKKILKNIGKEIQIDKKN